MRVVYSNHEIPQQIDGTNFFLAGPTPRSSSVESWRPRALDILSELKFKGTVFVPEWDVRAPRLDYMTQANWERQGLSRSAEHGRIIFWVPRELVHMPAFTTNVEFGYWLAKHPESILYGRPFWAAKCDYLDWLYTLSTNLKPFDELRALLTEAVNFSVKNLINHG